MQQQAELAWQTPHSDSHRCCVVCCMVCARLQAFDGADIIVHEIGGNVSLADLRERPAAVRDDRLVSSRFGLRS